jgi:putative lipoic acid-binding regulatory protein
VGEKAVNSLEGKKVALEYPCNWDYKVIINAHCKIKHIIENVIGDRTYKVTKSNNSKDKTYISYKVSLLVHSDEDRVALFHEFKKEDCVKIVL